MQNIKNEFLEAAKVLEEFISDEKNFISIEAAAVLIVDAFKAGKINTIEILADAARKWMEQVSPVKGM